MVEARGVFCPRYMYSRAVMQHFCCSHICSGFVFKHRQLSKLKLNLVTSCFRYEVFTGRILLAALDHNFHVFRKVIESQFKKVYSKRSGNWRAEAVKEPKQYSHLPLLLADILRRRKADEEAITRPIEVSPTNPVNLAPTIAMKRAPSTEELVKAKLSRFQPKKSE